MGGQNEHLGSGIDKVVNAIGEFAKTDAIELLSVIVYLIALVLVVSGLVGMARAGADEGRGGRSPFGGPMVTVIIGFLLIALPSFMDAGIATIFASEAVEPSIVAYDDSLTGSYPEAGKKALENILLIIMLFGWIAVVRGLLKMKAAANGIQQGGFASGLTHIIGGILAANIGGVIQVFQATFL